MVGKDSGKGSKLTPKQAAFVDEYLIDFNATQAAIRAGYSEKTASIQSFDLLRNPKIAENIKSRMKDREKRTEITQDMVLNRWWQLANADPNELIQFRRNACRRCHGKDHGFQWIDEAEYQRACADARAEDKTATLPSSEGGFGYKPNLDPHPECPACNGEGHGQIFAADTRKLSEPGRLLYDGVKQTKEGFEIKMQDRAKALENVARHLGMFNDKLTLKGDAENPLTLLMGQLAGKTFKPVED